MIATSTTTMTTAEVITLQSIFKQKITTAKSEGDITSERIWKEAYQALEDAEAESLARAHQRSLRRIQRQTTKRLAALA